ncbi:TonB-dependent receptor [bacterium SCSIO 12643]|nr:TonB-dependent receptor [bacterium SCSIO 12643]
MKKLIAILVLMYGLTTLGQGQKLTQTVRGTVLDIDSRLPLIGAQVRLVDSNPLVGTVTDVDGKFRLENVPLGRITLEFSYVGYESMRVPNIVVNSGKEVILNINMQEAVVKMNEFVVRANDNKGEALNDMVITSGRSVSIEETERYAGSFNDPSRILANFAGVGNSQDGGNDIIVRGNSPKYVQWRLEGIQITNPNHFADQNSVGGGISALNNNLLATSDFYTGAFSPEYGDVLSGVYDVKLRSGNNEKFESIFGLGLLGTDLTMEGPLKKGYGGSFLVNYRYSTVSLINDLGLVDINGTPRFQDATFKMVLPTKKAGTFSVFGLGGLSNLSLDDVKQNIWDLPGENGSREEITEDFSKDSYLMNLGLNHTLPLSKNSYLKTTLAYASNGVKDDVTENRWANDSIISSDYGYRSKIEAATYRGAVTYSNKLNAKNKIQIGTRFTLADYSNNQSMVLDSTSGRVTLVDFHENISNMNNFISWKHRLNENITLVGGIQNMNVLYNQKSTIEPRLAGSIKLNTKNTLTAGYGLHSTMESLHHYFAKVQQPDGSIIEPNKDLGLLKAHHFVVGFERRITPSLRAKVEVYYQHLYDLPVENNDTSYYATINEGLEFGFMDLVNEGTGKNYGVELTLERFFNNNYYFLITGSFFNSKYQSLEGVERNTTYNSNYLMNFLAGKQFDHLGKKKNQILSLNAKVYFGGGRKIIPLLRDDQGNLAVDPDNNQYWDYKKAYNNDLEDVYSVTISASYKFNREKTTHEIFLNLDNITNAQAKLSEYYDESQPNNIGYVSQFGTFPNLMYRIYF